MTNEHVRLCSMLYALREDLSEIISLMESGCWPGEAALAAARSGLSDTQRALDGIAIQQLRQETVGLRVV